MYGTPQGYGFASKGEGDLGAAAPLSFSGSLRRDGKSRHNRITLLAVEVATCSSPQHDSGGRLALQPRWLCWLGRD
jgi:hypothetical protein